MTVARTIGNPAGASQAVSDWRTGKQANGADVDLDASYVYIRANTTITKGQAVGLVVPTATVPPSVTPQTAAMDKRLYVGAAQHAATAGQYVQILTRGFGLIDAGAGSPAAESLVVIPATTTGVYDFTSTDPDATTVVGTIAGVALFTKNSDNLVFAFLDPK